MTRRILTRTAAESTAPDLSGMIEACEQRFGSDPAYRTVVKDPRDPASLLRYLLETLERQEVKEIAYKKRAEREIQELQQQLYYVTAQKNREIETALVATSSLVGQLHWSKSLNESLSLRISMCVRTNEIRAKRVEQTRVKLGGAIARCRGFMESKFAAMMHAITGLGKRIDTCEAKVAQINSHCASAAAQEPLPACSADEIRELRNATHQLTLDCDRQKREKEAAASKRDKYKARVSDLESENSKLKEQKLQIEKNLAACDGECEEKIKVVKEKCQSRVEVAEERLSVSTAKLAELMTEVSQCKTREKTLTSLARDLQERLRHAKQELKKGEFGINQDVEAAIFKLEARYIAMENVLSRVLIAGSIVLSLFKHHCPLLHQIYFGTETNIAALTMEQIIPRVFEHSTSHIDYSAVMFGPARHYASNAIVLQINRNVVDESALQEISVRINELREHFFFVANSETALRLGKYFPNPKTTPVVESTVWDKEPGFVLRVFAKKGAKAHVAFHPASHDPYITMKTENHSCAILTPTMLPLFKEPVTQSVIDYNAARNLKK